MRRLARASLALVAVTVVLGACTPQVGATFEDGVEHLPGPGEIHLVTDPPIAGIELAFVVIQSGGDSSVTTTIAAGEPVVVDLTTLPGIFAMRMNGTACDGRFPVQEGRMTDIIVRITLDGCATTVSGIRAIPEMVPP
jgi:hypothetical protein